MRLRWPFMTVKRHEREIEALKRAQASELITRQTAHEIEMATAKAAVLRTFFAAAGKGKKR